MVSSHPPEGTWRTAPRVRYHREGHRQADHRVRSAQRRPDSPNLGATALANALRHNNSVTVLKLTANAVSDDGASALARAIQPSGPNASLRELHLSGNAIADAGAQALARAVQVGYKRDKLIDEIEARFCDREEE